MAGERDEGDQPRARGNLQQARRRPRQECGERERQAEPDRADQAEAGIGEHRPDAAMQAYRDNRRAIDFGGEPNQPDDAAQDRDRERDPNHPGQAAAQRQVIGRWRVSRTRHWFRYQPHKADRAKGQHGRCQVHAARQDERIDQFKHDPYGPTRKVKLPCVRWVSTERTCQLTV